MKDTKRIAVRYFSSKWSFTVWLCLLPLVIGQWFWEWGIVWSFLLLAIISVNLYFIVIGWWYKGGIK